LPLSDETFFAGMMPTNLAPILRAPHNLKTAVAKVGAVLLLPLQCLDVYYLKQVFGFGDEAFLLECLLQR
jgi:hypothetical protein